MPTLDCINTTIDEIGGSNVGVDIKVYFMVWPAERQTRDYPGCPEYFELSHAEVTKAFSENWEHSRRDRTDWFQWLDDYVDNILYDIDDFYGWLCIHGGHKFE